MTEIWNYGHSWGSIITYLVCVSSLITFGWAMHRILRLLSDIKWIASCSFGTLRQLELLVSPPMPDDEEFVPSCTKPHGFTKINVPPEKPLAGDSRAEKKFQSTESDFSPPLGQGDR